MANDLVYIRCRQCKDERLFIKYYPTQHAGGCGMMHLPPCNDATSALEFDRWIELHLHCTEKKNQSTLDLHGDPGFELRTESDPKGRVTE